MVQIFRQNHFSELTSPRIVQPMSQLTSSWHDWLRAGLRNCPVTTKKNKWLTAACRTYIAWARLTFLSKNKMQSSV